MIPIYNSIAPKSVSCQRDARHFLVEQQGLKLESPMTTGAVIQVLINASIVRQAIAQFEHEIVWRVRSKFTLSS